MQSTKSWTETKSFPFWSPFSSFTTSIFFYQIIAKVLNIQNILSWNCFPSDTKRILRLLDLVIFSSMGNFVQSCKVQRVMTLWQKIKNLILKIFTYINMIKMKSIIKCIEYLNKLFAWFQSYYQNIQV